MRFIGRTQPYIAGPGVAGPVDPGRYGGSIFDPGAGDAPILPRDYAQRQIAQRANALRTMGMDFLLPGNRVAGIGSPFKAGKGTGFQLSNNSGIIPQVTAGKQLSDINPPMLTWQQLQSGMRPPETIKTLPGNPMFQNIPNQGMGFMLPGNRPPVKK